VAGGVAPGSLSAMPPGLNLLSGGAPVAPAGGPLFWTFAAAARQEIAAPAAAARIRAAAASATPTVVAEIPLPGLNAWDIVVSPDDRRVYLADAGGNAVKIFDTSTKTVTGSISLGDLQGDFPTAMALSPDGTRLYVANYHSQKLSVIDTGRNVITASVPVGKFEAAGVQLAVSPDNRYVYVPYETQLGAEGNYRAPGFVAVIDTTTNTIVSRIPVGNRPTGIAVSPNGRQLYVVNEYEPVVHGPGQESSYGTVSVIDTSSRTVTATITSTKDLQTYGMAVAISPDGAKLFVNVVTLIDLTTQRVLDRIVPSDGPQVLSPDGTRLYINGYDAALHVVDSVTGTTLGTVPLENSQAWGRGRTVAVSSNGQHVYAISKELDNPNLRLTVLDTGIGGGVDPGGGFTNPIDALLSVTSISNEVTKWLDNLSKVWNYGAVLNGGLFVKAVTEISDGLAKGDLLKTLSGVADVGTFLLQGPPAVILGVAKFAISVVLPLSVDDQTKFFNFRVRCMFHKDSGDLSRDEAQQLVNRYSGLPSIVNIPADYARYNVGGWFGAPSC